VGTLEINMCSLGAPMAIATGLVTGLVDAQSVDQVNFRSVPRICFGTCFRTDPDCDRRPRRKMNARPLACRSDLAGAIRSRQ
jgi:hypothetical protein